MFRFTYKIYNLRREDINNIKRLASDNYMCVQHKLGYYGNLKRHELYVIGGLFDYLRFKRAYESIYLRTKTCKRGA